MVGTILGAPAWTAGRPRYLLVARPHALLAALVLASGCKGVEPAPTDLDGLVHFLWLQYPDGTDEQLAEAVRNLDEAAQGATLDQTLDGTISPLSLEEAGLVDMDQGDFAAAQGLFVVRDIACTLDQLEPILYHLEQGDLYEGSYDAYQRTYTSDLDAYLSRSEPHLSWEVDYTATLLGATYDSHLNGGLRYVPALDAEASPWGPAVVARVWIPVPAAFPEGSNKSMDQDYQIELFYEREPGRIVHLYGAWKQGNYGAGLTADDEVVQRIILNNMADWDDVTERLCAEGRP